MGDKVFLSATKNNVKKTVRDKNFSVGAKNIGKITFGDKNIYDKTYGDKISPSATKIWAIKLWLQYFRKYFGEKTQSKTNNHVKTVAHSSGKVFFFNNFKT